MYPAAVKIDIPFGLGGSAGGNFSGETYMFRSSEHAYQGLKFLFHGKEESFGKQFFFLMQVGKKNRKYCQVGK